MELIWMILLSVFIVSLVSVVGIFTLYLNTKRIRSIIFLLMSFAAGSMLGAAFFDMLPEALEFEGIAMRTILVYALLGVLVFFGIEKVIHWYHCHRGRHEPHEYDAHKPVAYLSLVADAMHNFLDGVAIAIGFLTGMPIGIAITLAVIAHEIPQEISDFGVLIYGGFSTKKALFCNFLSALTAFLGAVLAYYFSGIHGNGLNAFLLAFSGGGFIYMASVNLIPELQKEKEIKKSLMQIALLFLGVAIILILTKMV